MTVNPALFRELAQGLGLDAIVDAIVVSGEERTIDKGVLCQIALERMRIDCPSERALLIDNRRENLDAWAGRGGIGISLHHGCRVSSRRREGSRRLARSRLRPPSLLGQLPWRRASPCHVRGRRASARVSTSGYA